MSLASRPVASPLLTVPTSHDSAAAAKLKNVEKEVASLKSELHALALKQQKQQKSAAIQAVAEKLSTHVKPAAHSDPASSLKPVLAKRATAQPAAAAAAKPSSSTSALRSKLSALASELAATPAAAGAGRGLNSVYYLGSAQPAVEKQWFAKQADLAI